MPDHKLRALPIIAPNWDTTVVVTTKIMLDVLHVSLFRSHGDAHTIIHNLKLLVASPRRLVGWLIGWLVADVQDANGEQQDASEALACLLKCGRLSWM